MHILSIDTSCDETAAAVTEGRRVLSNVLYSQMLMHREWGGVVPSIAKRAHEERIDFVVDEAVRKSKIGGYEALDAVAVTQGPGLAIALEVGIRKAKTVAAEYQKPLIAVNHMEGHIYSCFVQNSQGNPVRPFAFPYLAILVSGGHSEFVVLKDHLDFQIIGRTRDDAAGEALDKAARMLGFGYPGGPVIERLAKEAGNSDVFQFPRAMLRSHDMDLSFSGLKTALLYFLRSHTEEEKREQLKDIASSFQEAVFDSIIRKAAFAMRETGINRLVLGGGVAANMRLRQLLRELAAKNDGSVLYPPYKYLTGDNAAMIGVAAGYRAQKGMFVAEPESLERVPRLSL